MYISTCIHNRILSPTLLWVWKFDLKLGSWTMIFKFTTFTWVLRNHAKSKVFQSHSRPVAFFGILRTRFKTFFLKLRFSVGRKMTFPKCDFPSGKRPNWRIFLKLRRRSRQDGRRRWWRRSRPNECGRRVDQAATISLRGPKIFTQRGAPAPNLRMDGWMGWMGRWLKRSFHFFRNIYYN